MQVIKYKYSVDALKVCYSINEIAYNRLTEEQIYNEITKEKELIKEFIFKSPNSNDIYTEDFRIVRIKDYLEFRILVPDEEGTGNLQDFGFLEVKSKNDKKFSGKCFITLDNRRLYEPFAVHHEVLSYKTPKEIITIESLSNISDYVKLPIKQPKTTKRIQYNTIFFLKEMANRLGLSLYSISNLEIALDSNINFGKLIKKANANPDLIPVINRMPYPDINSTVRLANTTVPYSTTRKRIVNMGYLLKQAKGELQLKCYNKVEEIQANNNNKAYIYKWLGWDTNIHRTEITAKWSPIKAYCKSEGLSLEDFLYNLDSDDILNVPFELWLNRLIHYKLVGEKEEMITVFDIVMKVK